MNSHLRLILGKASFPFKGLNSTWRSTHIQASNSGSFLRSIYAETCAWACKCQAISAGPLCLSCDGNIMETIKHPTAHLSDAIFEVKLFAPWLKVAECISPMPTPRRWYRQQVSLYLLNWFRRLQMHLTGRHGESILVTFLCFNTKPCQFHSGSQQQDATGLVQW